MPFVDEHYPTGALAIFPLFIGLILELSKKSILGALIEPFYSPVFAQVFFLYSLSSGNIWSAYYHLPKAVVLLNVPAITRLKKEHIKFC